MAFGKTSLSEINVTPLVDVMLVLLIVFMVSAPLMQQGVDVNLPKANAGNISQSQEPVVISVLANQTLHLDGKTVSLNELSDKLKALSIKNPGVAVLVQADEAVNYGVVAQAMAEVKQANITKVGLVMMPK